MPQKILTKVTVTGADDTTNISDLAGLQEKYPYAEFGILLSNRYSINETGGPRFPSNQWLRKLIDCCIDTHSVKLNLSGHFCGQWVKDIFNGRFPEKEIAIPRFQAFFERFQLNTHAEPHNATEFINDVLYALARNDQTAIFQLDGKDGTRLAESMIAMDHTHIAGLFDLSHGAGVLPENWPMPYKGMPCGYAGGLSPENVQEQLEKIAIACNGMPTWIDAETQLMGSYSGRFCLYRAEKFLEAAKDWVI